MKLPAQSWIANPGARIILDTLDTEGGVTRLVGGAVRDALAGLEVADVDLATSLAPQQVIARLKEAGVKAIPTGMDHGTVTAVADGFVAEVTTLRRDVSTDGRRATVAFTDNWREDAARRDFTFNALSANPFTGELFDYFGGVDDLRSGTVRFIGAPLQRIAEDHLRILRFFRFHARFGKGTPDPDGLAACAARANDLMALSRERIRDEVLKLLMAPGAVGAVQLMLDHGIWRPILPEISAAGCAVLASLAQAEARADIPANAIRRLAALLPADPRLADGIGRRLKLSNLERRRLVLAAGRSDTDLAMPVAALAYRLGAEESTDRLLLLNAPAGDVDRVRNWQRPLFPVSGGMLVDRGVDRGPRVSALLRAIEDDWINEGFPASPAGLERIVARHLLGAGIKC